MTIFKNTLFIRTSIILVLFFINTCLPSAADAGDKQASKVLTEQVPGSGVKELSIETINGSISVRGNGDDVVYIEAECKVTGPERETCEDLLSKVKVVISEKKNRIKIQPDTPKKFKYSFSVSFNIKAPRLMHVQSESMNGSISIENMDNGVHLETMNGGISCENVNGDIWVETVNGGISLQEIRGDTHAEVVNGSVEVVFRDAAPEKVQIASVNGKVKAVFTAVPNARIHAETINGSIIVAGERVLKKGVFVKEFDAEYGNGKGRYSFETVNGSVVIDMPVPD